MKKVILTHTIYKESENEDFDKAIRFLDTEKRFAEIDSLIQESEATAEIYKDSELVDLENVSVAEFRKLSSMLVKDLEIHIEQEKSSNALKRLSTHYIVNL